MPLRILLQQQARKLTLAGSMLSTREAVRIGRQGGKARARNLSPERRREIAAWAQFVRKQREQGAATLTELKKRTILVIRVENPDLAALLTVISRMPMKYGQRVAEALSDREKETIEQAWQTVSREGAR